jgi:hypothetical protein
MLDTPTWGILTENTSGFTSVKNPRHCGWHSDKAVKLKKKKKLTKGHRLPPTSTGCDESPRQHIWENDKSLCSERTQFFWFMTHQEKTADFFIP